MLSKLACTSTAVQAAFSSARQCAAVARLHTLSRLTPHAVQVDGAWHYGHLHLSFRPILDLLGSPERRFVSSLPWGCHCALLACGCSCSSGCVHVASAGTGAPNSQLLCKHPARPLLHWQSGLSAILLQATSTAFLALAE